MAGQIQKRIPLLDLGVQYRAIREEIVAEVLRLMDRQQFVMGEPVRQFEEAMAEYCRAGFAIGCASGSDALLLALMAADIRAGDEVVTTPFTFFATAGSIARLGARPVFADIDAESFNLDPARVAEVLAGRPGVRALMPVHLYGGCAEMDELNALAGARGVTVIEDAAQAIGAEYKGRRAGTLARVGCFSFFPSKNLGAFGDAGLLTTGDAELAQRLARLRVHGGKDRYYHDEAGINSRIDALQAGVLRVKLRHLDDWTAARQRNAECYRALLGGLEEHVRVPRVAAAQTRHISHQFVIRARSRDALKACLAEHGVGSEVYYPLPLHLQKCFAYLGYREGDFPEAERAAREVLALPVYPELALEDVEYICETIRDFCRAA